MLAGGIPLSKKVEYQKEVATEERGKVLYLYASRQQQPAVLSQDGMTYDGLGAAMKLSRELNFTYLISELRRLSPEAAYDDRLLKRVGQTRLLGPALKYLPGVYGLQRIGTTQSFRRSSSCTISPPNKGVSSNSPLTKHPLKIYSTPDIFL